jgi:hypothetical protein
MKEKILYLSVLVHGLLSFAGFLLINTWSVGLADAGALSGGGIFRATAWLVDKVLLQPFAGWAIERLELAWWTWSGLTLSFALIVINSAAVIGVIGWLFRALRQLR